MMLIQSPGKSFFEIGGELIELQSDYRYATGDISAKKRKQHRATARDVKSTGKDLRKISKQVDNIHTWGPAESIGFGIGVWIGIGFAIATFPVTQADSPLIGPADAAWLAGVLRFMNKSTSTGRDIGGYVDDKMGWD